MSAVTVSLKIEDFVDANWLSTRKCPVARASRRYFGHYSNVKSAPKYVVRIMFFGLVKEYFRIENVQMNGKVLESDISFNNFGFSYNQFFKMRQNIELRNFQSASFDLVPVKKQQPCY